MPRKKARLTNNDPLTPTDHVLAGLSNLSNNSQPQQVNNLSSNQAEKLDSQLNGKLESQIVKQSTSQQVKTEDLRKATFKIDSQVLERLEQYHLKLQLELGKRNTPYKETIVELAILELLDQLESNSESLWLKLQQQQELRQKV